jgi:hypothetical protein
MAVSANEVMRRGRVLNNCGHPVNLIVERHVSSIWRIEFDHGSSPLPLELAASSFAEGAAQQGRHN